MKIALVGPGILPIPPPGWGAVEILIWEYTLALHDLGHQVEIINLMRKSPLDSQQGSEYSKTIIQHINGNNFDVVHIHYDCLWHILPEINAKIKIITSHYPYIDVPEKYNADGFMSIFKGICNNNNHYIAALSCKDHDMWKKHALNKNNIFYTLNGASAKELHPCPIENKKNSARSIYLAKVEIRKNQHKYYGLKDVDFYGQCTNCTLSKLPQFKGELMRKDIPNVLSSYGNLVLLSEGEGTPLVVKEALMCGLPIVTNTQSTSDLPDLPFIDIIPDNRLNDLEYINEVIELNRQKQYMVEQIREYALSHYSWHILVKKYIETITSL